MNEHFKQDSTSPEADLSVAAMLKKIQQQLNFLELKLDKLIEFSAERSSFRKPSFGKDRHFSKPFRPGGGGGHFGSPRPSHPQGDRQGAPQTKEFGKPHRPERGRKAFFRKRESKGQFPPR